MGSTQSTEQTNTSSSSSSKNNNSTTTEENKGTFDVKIEIDNSSDIQEKPSNSSSSTSSSSTTTTTSIPLKDLEDSYKQGYIDGSQDMDRKLNLVANEAHESIQQKLNIFQQQQVEKTKKDIEFLKHQLKDSKPLQNLCEDERNNLLKCLQENSSTPLSCRLLSNALSNCASASLQNK